MLENFKQAIAEKSAQEIADVVLNSFAENCEVAIKSTSAGTAFYSYKENPKGQEVAINDFIADLIGQPQEVVDMFLIPLFEGIKNANSNPAILEKAQTDEERAQLALLQDIPPAYIVGQFLGQLIPKNIFLYIQGKEITAYFLNENGGFLQNENSEYQTKALEIKEAVNAEFFKQMILNF